MRKRLVIFGLLLCTVISFSIMPSSAQEMDYGLFPTELTATLYPGESIMETKTANLPPGPAPKGDVVFALDLTGSMGTEINAAKSQAIGIMTALSGVITDVQFGVVSFMDYPAAYDSCGYAATYGSALAGDYAYRLDQAVTNDQTAVQTALNGLTLGSGSDGPQDYTRVIYEAYADPAIGWRTGAIKFLIIFGDAPTHDCDFFSTSYGADPGRNGIIGDADDLDFETTLVEAAAFGLKIIAMDSSDRFSDIIPYSDHAEESFREMAEVTGGLWVNSYGLDPPYTAIIDLITDAIASVVAVIDVLTLSVDPVEFASWVTVTPAAYFNVERPGSRVFTVTITVPEDTPCGNTYEFEIWANGDGADYGRQLVTITVPCPSDIPLFSNVMALFPVGVLSVVLIVHQRRRKRN